MHLSSTGHFFMCAIVIIQHIHNLIDFCLFTFTLYLLWGAILELLCPVVHKIALHLA